MSKLLKKATSRSFYTFEDFLLRLQRSRSCDVPRLYMENQILFQNREDMLQRCIRGVSWRTATQLLGAASCKQPLAADTFRYLLARMLVHNTRIGKLAASGANVSSDPAVCWRVALRVVSEAYVHHGQSTPSRVLVSGLRLLQPSRSWRVAIKLLKFSQISEQLSAQQLLDAAGCCATPSSWELSFRLLTRLHEAKPEMLVGAITSMLPENPESVYALLPQPQRSLSQQHVLDVIGGVVGSAPAKVVLNNEFCLSYLSHLLLSPVYISGQRVDEAVQRLSWEQAMSLFVRAGFVDAFRRRRSPDQLPESSARAAGGGVVPAESTSLPAVVGDGSAQRHVSALLMSCVVRRMPSLNAARLFLNSLDVDRSSLQHHSVASALLHVSVREKVWKEALELLSTISLTAGSASREDSEAVALLVDQLNAVNAYAATATILVPALVPLRIKLDTPRLRLVFQHIHKYNLSLVKDTRKKDGGHPLIPWEAALGWATLLAHNPSRALSGATQHAHATPEAGVSDGKIAATLVHLCVLGGSPQGALRVMNQLRSAGHASFASEREIRALLFCMKYGRDKEAAHVVRHAASRLQPAAAKPLLALHSSWKWQ